MHETASRCPAMHLAVASAEAINCIAPPSPDLQIGNLPHRPGHAIHFMTLHQASISFPDLTVNDEEQNKDSQSLDRLQEFKKMLPAMAAQGLKHDEVSASVHLSASIRRPARHTAVEFRSCAEPSYLDDSQSHEDEYSLEIDCINTQAEEKDTVVPSRRVPSISLRPRLKAYTDRNLDDLLLPTHF